MTRGWADRSQVEWFDLYTRASLYVVPVAVPALMLGGLANADGASGGAAVLAGIVIAQTVVCLALVHRVITRRAMGTPRPSRLFAAATVISALGAVASVVVAPASGGDGWVLAVLFAVAYLGAMSIVVSLRVVAAAALLVAVLPVLADLVFPTLMPDGGQSGWFIAALGGSFGAIGGYRGSLWMLDVVHELDRARGAQARLAVAEERLRFSRDLHDVLGRSLSVVALKSELAAQLAKRGRPEAADEMLEVRQVAQDLLAEVRDVVRGYRTADLAAELAGARSVLASAGVDCRVLDSGELPEPVQNALGWVVREATTNVLRHSDAASCTIAVRHSDGVVELTVDNDGVRPAAAGRNDGHGLRGLAERLSEMDGQLSAEHQPGQRFRLTATLPLESRR